MTVKRLPIAQFPEEPGSGVRLRPRTEDMRRMSMRDLELGRRLFPPDEDEPRPQVRADCERSERPCPFVGCVHHLALDVKGSGAITFVRPELEDMPETCALDVADGGPSSLEEVGRLLNVTRERVRQIEARALRKFAKNAARLGYTLGVPVAKLRHNAAVFRAREAVLSHVRDNPGIDRWDLLDLSDQPSIRAAISRTVSALVREGKIRNERGCLWLM